MSRSLERKDAMIELTLVDLWTEVRDDNNSVNSGLVVERLVDKAFESCAECKAESISKEKQRRRERWSLFGRPRLNGTDSIETSSSIAEQTRQRLIHSVTKYVKISDKYLALCSVLLKSRAYHLAHASATSAGTGVPLPVVELPRTTSGKPFIPPISDEQLEYPISVSHQFPFVGIVSHIPHGNVQSIQLGLDIVVYEAFNRKLYGSVDDFIEVFRDSFTAWEWSRINNINSASDDQRLKEFYLRWAIKEAYTKALGVGMSVEFSSFEVRLAAVDDDSDTAAVGGLATLLQGSTTSIRYRASVLYYNGDESANRNRAKELDLFFLPLTVNEEGQERSGCACICVTALSDHHHNELNIQWITFDSLIEWHRNPL